MKQVFSLAARLRRDTSGVALLEFAFSMPIVLSLGLLGIETSNYALMHLKVSQIALSLADNASRVGTTNALSQQQLREVDMNDVLQAARLQGDSINLTTNARIIVSSLENIQQSYDSAPVQRVHWQRCIGLKSGTNFDSRVTTTTNDGTDGTQANDGTLAASGMGDTGSMVSAPSGAGVMFVEVNYQYTPIVGAWLVGSPPPMRYVASFIVRDRRIFTQIYNPSPTSVASKCNLFTKGVGGSTS